MAKKNKDFNNTEMEDSKVVTGYLLDEHDLLSAVKSLKNQGVTILDVRSPYPIHGLDVVLEFKPSNISKVAFIAGTVTFLATLGGQIAISTLVYPINYGGKPLISIPSFMPITLMMTFLVTIVSIATAFFMRSNLGPGANIEFLDEGATDDRFQIIVPQSGGLAYLSSVNCIDVKEVEIKK